MKAGNNKESAAGSQGHGKRASLSGPAVHPDSAPVKSNDFLYKRKAKAVPFHGVGTVALVKAVKYFLLSMEIHPGPLIGDQKRTKVARFAGTDCYRPFFRGKFHSIIDQVYPYLFQKIRPAGDLAFFQIQVEPDLFFCSFRLFFFISFAKPMMDTIGMFEGFFGFTGPPPLSALCIQAPGW